MTSLDNSVYSRKNLIFKKKDDYYIVFSPDQPNIAVVDAYGKKFLQLADGQRSIEGILDIMANDLGISKSELSEGFSDFVASMLKDRILLREDDVPSDAENQAPEKLEQLILHLTNACNLCCTHCYVESGSPLSNEMSETSLLRVIDEFIDLGGKNLVITGGEPLLKRELLRKVVEKSKESGIQKIVVDTNGTLLKKNDAEFFKKYSVHVGVSLDGATAATHNLVRGEGQFHKTLEGIKLLVEAGAYTTASMTIMKPNESEIEKLLNLAKRLGVSDACLNIVKNQGRAKKHADELAIPISRTSKIYELIRRSSRRIGIKTNLEQLFDNIWELARRETCGVGVTILSIHADGNVYPCDAFIDENFKAGNIKTKSLAELWSSSETLRRFRDLNVMKISGCKSCELRFVCAGGCLADIYYEHKSFTRRPSSCPSYRKIWWNMISDIAEKMWAELSAQSQS